VHVAGLAADERFIYLHFPATATEFRAVEVILDSKPKALQHKPCGLLSDTQSAVNFHAGNAVLAIDEQPKTRHPLIKSKGRILENGSEFQAELLLALVAEPYAASLDKRVFRFAATWANNFAIRPAETLRILESAVGVGEVNDSFLESVRCVHE
jgi:hypothetical protein